MSHVENVLKKVKQTNPGQPEFIQAVTEVLEAMGPVIKKHPEYVESAILERLMEPER